MRILFIHNNFPGQFIHLAAFLSTVGDNEVTFISEFGRNDIHIKTVKNICVENIPSTESNNESQKALLENYARGLHYGKALKELANEGWSPDVIVEHAGWGAGMFAADIFPQALRISYFEWFYTKGAYFHFFAHGQAREGLEFAANRQRNLCQLDALHECHIGLTPTFWQFSQYPSEYAYKMRIIHEGIDTTYFSPAGAGEKPSAISELDITGMKEIVTYSARGLEPTRGFPSFYAALPRILDARPDCHVVIMGNDSCHYSAARKDGKGWGEYMREQIAVDPARVHFLPFASYADYRSLLRASALHIYLTAPFVLSWSLLEAMSCECLILTSDTEPVREAVRHTHNGFLTSFFDSDEIARSAAKLLESREQCGEVRKNARKTVLERYDSRVSVNQFMHLLHAHAR